MIVPNEKEITGGDLKVDSVNSFPDMFFFTSRRNTPVLITGSKLANPLPGI